MTDRMTMAAVVRRHAAEDPAKAVVVDPAATLTYGELDSGTAELAAALVAAGVSKGSRVGLIMPNGVDWVRMAVAVTRIGAVLIPLSTVMAAPELVAQLRAASVQFLITVSELRGHRYLDAVSDSHLPALRQVWAPDQVARLAGSAATRRVSDALALAVRPADSLAVIFTSGSSGPPKGVIHSHGSAFGAVGSGLAARCIDADTRLYLPMPLFWVGGFGAGVLSVLTAGATLVTEPLPRPDATLRLLERERVTLFRGWPDQAEALARHAAAAGTKLPALRVGSLEALLPAEQRAAPGARANLFGMTESFGPYCRYPADTDMPASARGSCGKPFPGMDVRIVDTATGSPLPVGAAGMIQIRGPHTLRGICRRSREDLFTADGFYPTGDLGHLDGDGFLFYHGRSDDMFKVSGATVYPAEVERALRTLAGVRAAHVTNIPGPQGFRVGAALVCPDRTADVDSLRSAAGQQLSSFKVPTVWLLLNDDNQVPRGATGKVDKNRLRAMLVDRGSDHPAVS